MISRHTVMTQSEFEDSVRSRINHITLQRYLPKRELPWRAMCFHTELQPGRENRISSHVDHPAEFQRARFVLVGGPCRGCLQFLVLKRRTRSVATSRSNLVMTV